MDAFELPALEDAESIQVALMQVLRLIISKHIDPKTAGLMLYGLQTASLNLKRIRFEPTNKRTVVIEPRTVADNALDEFAWYEDEYEDEPEEADDNEEAANPSNDQASNTDEPATETPETEQPTPITPAAKPLRPVNNREELIVAPPDDADSASGPPPTLASLLSAFIRSEELQPSP